METERVSLSLSDIAKSLVPGSQFSLGAAETLSDKYDSALEVLLERQHQLTTKIREANLEINNLQKHCLQLRNTITEAQKGNRSVLKQDHSLIIDDDDLNDEANGITDVTAQNRANGHTQGHTNASAQNSAKSKDMNDQQPETAKKDKADDELRLKYRFIQPRNSLTFMNATSTKKQQVETRVQSNGLSNKSTISKVDTTGQNESSAPPKKVETRGRKKKVETRGRKKKVETRGRKKKVVEPPALSNNEPVLVRSPSQVIQPLPTQNPHTLHPTSELYPNTPSQEQSVSRTTNGPYSFRTTKKSAVPSYYRNSEVLDQFFEKVREEKKDTDIYRAPGQTPHKRKRRMPDTEDYSYELDSTMKESVSDKKDDAVMENRQLDSIRLPSTSKNQTRKSRVKVERNGNRRTAREKRAIKFLEEHPDGLKNPKFPLKVGPKATLVNIGEIYPANLFYSDCVIFPIGYELIREFRSIVTPDAFSNYTCKITKEGDHPLFHVLPHDAPGVEITSLSPSGCWAEVLKRANKLISAENRANTASGIEYFHLGHAIPKLLIELLPDAEKCIGYRFIHPDKVHLNEDVKIP